MYPFFTAIFLLIIAACCGYNAKLRGRSPFTWFVIGLFLGAVGLLILYLLPSKKTIFKPSPFIDKQTHPVAKSSVISQSNILPLPTDQKFWYYLNNENKRFGPMSFDRLKQAWAEKEVCHETYVWNESMEDWKLIKDLSDLLSHLGDIPATS